MSETKWTPGPWECSPVSGIVGSLIQSDLGIKVGAAFPQGTPRAFSAPLTEANAQLIATSPELYDALEQACNIIAFQAAAMDVRTGNSKCSDGCLETLKEYGRLLAKARGEALIDQQPEPESDLERDRR